MTETPPASRRDERLELWERYEVPFFRFLPYPLLALCLIFDLVSRGLHTSTAVDAGLAALTVLVLAAVDRVDRRVSWLETQERPGVVIGAGAFLTLAVLAAALVVSNPVFGFFSWTGYLWAWRLLRGNWRFGGVATIALIVAVSQTGSGPYSTVADLLALLAVWLINGSIASALTWFGWIGNEREERRALQVSALTEANAKLEESMRENAALQEQLLAQAREAGIWDERRRMAAEIHDTLAQGLMGIITQLQAAQRTGAGPLASARHVELATDLARQSLSEARRSVRALTPEPLAEARLPEAVGDVARRWSDLHAVPVAFATTGTAQVMVPEIEVALLRTAQEALANVAKHAQASRVGLTLSYMGDVVTLDVRDDGVGFVAGGGEVPCSAAVDGGFGLPSMRQRIEGVGGTLAIESQPSVGTAISAAVPAVAAGGQR